MKDMTQIMITDKNFDFTAFLSRRVKLTVRKTDDEASANTGHREGDVIEGVVVENSAAAFGTGPTGVGCFHIHIESMHGVAADFGDEFVEWDDCEWATPEIVAKYESNELWKLEKGYEIKDGWFPVPVFVEIEKEKK